jgi:hypothetical protein
MNQQVHSTDQEMSRPYQASAQDASMDAEAAAKSGYQHSEVVKSFTLDPSAG